MLIGRNLSCIASSERIRLSSRYFCLPSLAKWNRIKETQKFCGLKIVLFFMRRSRLMWCWYIFSQYMCPDTIWQFVPHWNRTRLILIDPRFIAYNLKEFIGYGYRTKTLNADISLWNPICSYMCSNEHGNHPWNLLKWTKIRLPMI